MSDDRVISLTGHDLDLPKVSAIASATAKVTLADHSISTMRNSRAIVDRYIEEGIPAYGLNTGLGARVAEALPADELKNFSYHLVRGRAQGVGRLLGPDEARAVMLARLNTLLTGHAGASIEVATFLAELLNRNITPAMPATSSIGAGDLTALASMALALIGDGAFVVDGKPEPACDVLERHGIAPLRLGPKDGLVLCNTTSFSVGTASLSAIAARHTVEALQVAVAMSIEGFRGNTSTLQKEVSAIRPQPGQQQAAEQIRRLIEGGLLLDTSNARRLQDPLSFRCASQVNGSALSQLAALEAMLRIELNGSGDSPVVIPQSSTIVSSANFHLPHLALQLDTVSRALAWCACDSVSRIQRLMNPGLSGLPPLLSSDQTSRAGFGPLLKPIEALRAEIIHLSDPVPVLPSHNADGAEDSLTLSPMAAEKLHTLAGKFNQLIAFELLAAAQAIDLARPARIAPGLQAVHKAIRSVSAFLDADRPVGREVENIANELVATGHLSRLAGLQA